MLDIEYCKTVKYLIAMSIILIMVAGIIDMLGITICL